MLGVQFVQLSYLPGAELSRPSPIRVLVVDDEPGVRRILTRFLECRGCVVAETADGGEALEALRVGWFDVVVSDVWMPVLDGATLWMRASLARPELRDRWVFVSALPLPRLLQAARQRHVAKPFDLERLWTVVCEVVGGGGSEPPVEDR